MDQILTASLPIYVLVIIFIIALVKLVVDSCNIYK